MVIVDNNALTVIRAYHYLYYWFHCDDEEIQWNGKHIMLSEFIEAYSSLHNFPASKVYVRFFGGPPGKEGFFNGSLLTLLNDKIKRWNLKQQKQSVLK